MVCPKCRFVEMRRNRKNDNDIFICPKCGEVSEEPSKTL